MPQDSLHVTDNRTGREYTIPIQNGAIPATAFSNFEEPSGPSRTYSSRSGRYGLCVLDPALRNTAVKQSKVSFLDAEKGILLFRDQNLLTCTTRTYEDVAFLLIWGRYPSLQERKEFSRSLAQSMLDQPAEIFQVIASFPRDASVYHMMMAGIVISSAVSQRTVPLAEQNQRYSKGEQGFIDKQIIRTIAALTVSVAAGHCHHHSLQYEPPRLDSSYVENFSRMMHLYPSRSAAQDAKLPLHTLHELHDKYLTQLMIANMEHGMAAGTLTFQVSASTKADPMLSLNSMFCTGSGPLHGAAVELVCAMLKRIGSPEHAPATIERAKAKKERLYGFGHRLYKTQDPRSKVLAPIAKELINPALLESFTAGKTEVDVAEATRLSETALELDRLVNTDEWFIKRRIKTGADLFTGIVCLMLGIPETSILPMISATRVCGAMAHWKELIDQDTGIWRPTHIYTGDIPEPQAKANL